MPLPQISVIIPTYNRVSLVAETINSVLAQTYRDYEIIVIDDGSEDETEHVLTALKSQPSRQFCLNYHRIPQSGASIARNTGLDLAQGYYIAFLDSDDRWRPRFLENMVTVLEKTSQAGFVYGDFATFNDEGFVKTANLNPDQKVSGNVLGQTLKGQYICTGTALIRKTCFNVCGNFDPRFPPAEDWDLWLRLSHHFEGIFVDEPLTEIRFHPGNMSRRPRLIAEQNLKILKKFKDMFPKAARRYQKDYNNILAKNHGLMAYYCRTSGQPWAALKHFLLEKRYLS